MLRVSIEPPGEGRNSIQRNKISAHYSELSAKGNELACGQEPLYVYYCSEDHRFTLLVAPRRFQKKVSEISFSFSHQLYQ